MIAESVVNINEAELVRQLLADDMCADFVLPPGVQDAHPFQCVPLQSLIAGRSKPEGDIDVLLCQKNAPELVTALQVKRIKVTTDSFYTGCANKANALKTLAKQANTLVTAGFARVYALAIIVTDSRTVPNPNPYRKSAPSSIINEVDIRLRSDLFAPQVGIFRTEIAQVMDNHHLRPGVFGGSFIRAATVQVQPDVLTNSLRSFIAQAGCPAH